MKIDVLIVLYNPRKEFLERVVTYCDYFNTVIIFDNTENCDEKRLDFFNFNNCKYISYGKNLGIAKALSEGARLALLDRADFLLTMDQDSIFPFTKIDDIKKILATEINSDFGILALNFNNTDDNCGKVKPVKWRLTSGNFINLKKYALLKEGFNEKLFIDAVDIDICYKMNKQGYQIGLIEGISIQHTIGNPVKKRFLFKSFSVLNYNEIRYYYMFRNNYYLFLPDKRYFRRDFYKFFAKYLIKILCFEKNKINKLKFIKLGLKDAKKGKLGKLELN